MRAYEAGTWSNALIVDSGWSNEGVRIDVHTTRGKTVTLTVQEWRTLNVAVEKIIMHCESERLKQLKEKK